MNLVIAIHQTFSAMRFLAVNVGWKSCVLRVDSNLGVDPNITDTGIVPELPSCQVCWCTPVYDWPKYRQYFNTLLKAYISFHSQDCGQSTSNFPCSLTRNITSHSMKNVAFHSLLSRMKDDYATNSHYLTCLLKGSEYVLLILGVEG